MSFAEWACEEQGRCQLNQDAVAIDGGMMIEKLCEIALGEKWWLTSVLPSKASIQQLLNVAIVPLHKNQIHVVIVFDGVPIRISKDDPPLHLTPSLETLTPHDTDRNDPTQKPCSDYLTEEGIIEFIHILQSDSTLDVIRAPYWSWSQIAELLASEYVQDVFGPVELLAFPGVSRVIVTFPIENRGVASAVSRINIKKKFRTCAKLGKDITDEELAELVVLTSSHLRFQKFCSGFNEKKAFFGSFDALATAALTSAKGEPRRVLAFVHQVCAEDARLFDTFFRILSAFKYGPVITPDFKCVPLEVAARKRGKAAVPAHKEQQNVSRGLRDLLGNMLPPAAYFFLFSGLLPPDVLNVFVHRSIVDTRPSIDNDTFWKIIEPTVQMRLHVANQLSAFIDFDDDKKNNSDILVYQDRRTNSQQPIGEPKVFKKPPDVAMGFWKYVQPAKNNFKMLVELGTNPLNAVCKGGIFECCPEELRYDTMHSTFACAVLNSLDLLGYFTHATHSNRKEETGKSVFSHALEVCPAQFLEAGVLVIELLRTKMISAEPGGVVVLATRILSVVPFESTHPWVRKVDVDLTNYICLVWKLHSVIRSIGRVQAVVTFLRNTNIDLSWNALEYANLASNLPFAQAPSLHAAIVADFVLRTDFATDSTETAWEKLRLQFPDNNITHLLESIFTFWLSARYVVKRLVTDDYSSKRIHRSVNEESLKEADRLVIGKAKLFFPTEVFEEFPRS